MKTSSPHLFASLMVTGLLLTTNYAAAQWGDAMVHNDFGSGTVSLGNCTSHMPGLQNLRLNPVTFKLCGANSGATEWSLEIRKDVSPYRLVTGCSWSRRPVSQSTFSCPITEAGNYRANITYWVSNSLFGHMDRKFVR